MTATTKLALELLQNNAANQTLANTTFAQLNQLVQAGVVDRTNTPPGSPADEALYIITATATGAWAGKENQLAYWLTSTNAWQYVLPREGMLVHVNDEDVYYKYNGSAWEILATGGGSSTIATQSASSTAGALDLSATTAPVILVTLTENITSITMPAGAANQSIERRIVFTQGGAGTYTIPVTTGAWGSIVVDGGGAIQQMGTGVGTVGVYVLANDNNGTWRMYVDQGNVVGPASSTDNNLPLFDGATGKLLKDSGTTVTAAGRALLDDANAAAQRTTLGLGAGDSPTFTALTLSNGQIAFPATQVPSANANTLDDYEEGTWTPVLTFATPGDLSLTYSAQIGTYRKIGSVVSVIFNVTTSSFTHSTAAGAAQITGLPFNAASGGTPTGTCQFNGITKSGYTDYVSRIIGGGSVVDLVASASGLAPSNVNSANMPTGGTVQVVSNITYFA